jgi:hypothetical protein
MVGHEMDHNERWLRGISARVKAYSLLEVVLASAICATALVPALALLRDGMLVTEEIDTRHMLLIYGVQKMEEQLAVVAATWTTASAAGDFAAEGHASIRFSLTRSDSAVSGGITDRLMSITVTTYNDDDGDDSLDSDEPRAVLTTKISKLATYESMAGS